MIKETENGIILKAKVKLNSSKFALKVKDESIIIEVKNPPHQGKANREIVTELSKIFGKEVEIISGVKSKDKIIFLKGFKKEEFFEKINEAF